VALVVYLMGAPARSKALKKRAELERLQQTAAAEAVQEKSTQVPMPVAQEAPKTP
jgi:hypothetical protein